MIPTFFSFFLIFVYSYLYIQQFLLVTFKNKDDQSYHFTRPFFSNYSTDVRHHYFQTSSVLPYSLSPFPDYPSLFRVVPNPTTTQRGQIFDSVTWRLTKVPTMERPTLPSPHLPKAEEKKGRYGRVPQVMKLNRLIKLFYFLLMLSQWPHDPYIIH